ncbi:hypothetical protein [Maribacter cobaltidurans]|nr:hypothetical protein [Maribacter cobaltidurans]GGD70399.1 hypothetical protein GCM10011412_04970 [Maribacter cobaltidurans]
MYTFIFTLAFIGFYLCYATSKRMVIANNFGFEEWCYENNLISNSIGVTSLLSAASTSIFLWGWGTGLFTFIIVLMTVGSIIIILQPLRLLNYLSLVTGLLIFLLFQYLFS